MANVQGTFYSGSTGRPNTTPESPPDLQGEQPFPVNPPGSGGGLNPTNVSYISLTDTDDTDYTGKEDFVPHVNETETGLILKRINKNVDGGFSNSVYLTVQEIDGGGA